MTSSHLPAIVTERNPKARCTRRTIYTSQQRSPLGTLTLATTDTGLCGIYFEEHRYFAGTDGWLSAHKHPHLALAGAQLDDYFNGTLTTFSLPLDFVGTPFQEAVWRGLIDLGFGQTTSYGAHAEHIGKPHAVRAVGTAIGRNPLSIVIPCHRVIGSAGALSGYAGGLDRKRALLELERRR